MAQKKIIQNILIRKINFTKEKIKVSADRIFSISKVRSNFPIEVLLDIQSQKRTRNNPYGLILNKVIPIKEKNQNG